MRRPGGLRTLAAAAAGVLLAGAGGMLVLAAWRMEPAAEAVALYEYVPTGERDPASLGLRGLPPGVRLAGYELRLPGREEALAELVAAERDGSRVVVSFRSLLAQPVESVDVDPAALAEVARAIREHAPPDALLLGWWDTSRRLALLTGRPARFDAPLAEPLLVPAPWRERRDELAERARRFRGGPVRAEDGDFARFVEALLAPPEEGVRMLHALAGEGPALLVLDLRDVYKLAAAAPERFPWGYRDFPAAEVSHGLIAQVKAWLRELGHSVYAVEPRPEHVVRVHHLGPRAAETLAARLLPFTSFDAESLPGPKLVFQHATYWVYELRPSGEAGADGPGAGPASGAEKGTGAGASAATVPEGRTGG